MAVNIKTAKGCEWLHDGYHFLVFFVLPLVLLLLYDLAEPGA